MQKQKSENKRQLFFEANSLLFCASFVLSQRERKIFDQLNPTSLLFFKNLKSCFFSLRINLKKKKTSKKERRRILHRTRARARCFVAGVEKRVTGRDTIRVAAVWQRSRGGLFRFFEEEEEEKAKKFRE